MRAMAGVIERLGSVLLCLVLLAPASGGAAETEKKSEPSRAELEQKLEAAQKRLDAAAREVADLSMSLSDDAMPFVMHFSGGRSQRAMLGINIGAGREETRDEGVEVLSVSPGGPAADAGLKAGDVIVELNGKSMQREGERSPRQKLLAAMAEAKPGDKVTVRYRRDGKVSTATVVAQHLPDRMFSFPTQLQSEAGRYTEMPHFAFRRAEGVFGSAELAPLTPKLGQYFGTEKGLLVVRAPSDSRLQLEDGDVIVDIDGRVPSSPAHALRILGSYQSGEKLKLNVLRMKKRMSFDITIPEDAPRIGHSRMLQFHTPGMGAVPPPPPPPPAGATDENPI